MRIDLQLQPDDPALAPLRAASHNAGARYTGRHRLLAQRAREHHSALHGTIMPNAVRETLQLVPGVADLLSSEHWQAPIEARDRFAGALAYFVEPDDLIPDSNSRYGYLDDAFVLKLALAESNHEWFAWCDYSDYLAIWPDEVGIDRATWMLHRRERLEVQLRKRNEQGYAPDGRRDGGSGQSASYVPMLDAPDRFGVR